jgi:hypothetical protein
MMAGTENHKLQDQHVAPEQLFDLACDVVAQAAVLVIMLLLPVILQDGRKPPLAKIVRACHRVETHGVEIGNPDLVPVRGQHLDRPREQRSIERLRLLMGIDDQDLHDRLSPPA